MNIKTLQRLFSYLLLAGSLAGLAACGGGDGGGDDDATGAVGSAAILITDATHADLDDVSVTIDSITLTGTDTDGNPITHTLDDLDIALNLKHLITTSYLVDLVQGIPAGEYDSIAIHVVRVVVDDYDDDEPAVTIQVDETVTLSLDDSPIVVSDGTTTTITLDFDLTLSLDEEDGEWTWRSRFFVHHGDDDDHKEVDDLRGTIAAPADLVCDPLPDGLTLTLTTLRTDREINVVVNEDTEVENEAADDESEDLDLAGLCALLGDLGDDETLRVEVTGSFEDGDLIASKLEIEDPDDVHVKGTITALTDPDGNPVVVTSAVNLLACSDTYGSMTVEDIFGDEYVFDFVAGHDVAFKNADECSDLEEAMAEQATVKVNGTRQDDDSIILDRVKLEDDDEHMEFERHRDRHMAIHGRAAGAPDDEGLFLIGDVHVKVDDHNKVIRTGQSNRHHSGRPVDIAEGSCLQLSGEVDDDNVLEAKNVVILPDTACR
ncbi:MAG: DUF4382 domain-containing protein [Nitrospirota bacterium]|jgi:hypothetical protein